MISGSAKLVLERIHPMESSAYRAWRLAVVFLRRPDSTSLCWWGLRGIPAATAKDNCQAPTGVKKDASS
ncbi:MAG: hypothetical protein ABW092_15010 [Candidatus Thiodiazotropha sp.]